MSRNK